MKSNWKEKVLLGCAVLVRGAYVVQTADSTLYLVRDGLVGSPITFSELEAGMRGVERPLGGLVARKEREGSVVMDDQDKAMTGIEWGSGDRNARPSRSQEQREEIAGRMETYEEMKGTARERRMEGGMNTQSGVNTQGKLILPGIPSVCTIPVISTLPKIPPAQSIQTAVRNVPTSLNWNRRRIDKIVLEDDGCVVYGKMRIPIASLFGTPFLKDNISIMANSTHVPYIIDNLFVAVASIDLEICDIENLNRRTISMKYVVHWKEEYGDYAVEKNALVIEGVAYTFPSAVAGVFRIVQQGGLGYMVRLYNGSAQNAIRKCAYEMLNGEMNIGTNIGTHSGTNIEMEKDNRIESSRETDIKANNGLLTHIFDKPSKALRSIIEDHKYIPGINNRSNNCHSIRQLAGSGVYDHSYIKSIIDSSHAKAVPGIVRRYTDKHRPGRQTYSTDAPNQHFDLASLVHLYHRHSFFHYLIGHLNLLILGIALAGTAILLYRRNLRSLRRVADRTYTASFLGQPCLVYHIHEFGPTAELRPLKISQLVHIHGLSYAVLGLLPFRKIAVTEATQQYTGTDHPAFRAHMFAVVSGLEALHANALAHGLLCPENIRAAHDGSVKIQRIFCNPGWQSATRLSCPGALSFAQAQTDDFFALGCIIHFYITGHHPFDSVNPKRSKPIVGARVPNRAEYQHTARSPPSDPPFTQHTGNNHQSPIYYKALSDPGISAINQHIRNTAYYIRVEDYETHDLIYSCIFKGHFQASRHPYFWAADTKAEFICDVSDFLDSNFLYRDRIENMRAFVFERSWAAAIDPQILRHMEKRRQYRGDLLADLLRLIRNSYRHYQELTGRELQSFFTGGIIEYYLGRFPRLVLALYKYKHLRQHELFKKYYGS